MICTRLRPGHLSVRVGDGSRRNEEIEKKSRNAPLNATITIITYLFVWRSVLGLHAGIGVCWSFRQRPI